MTTYEKVLMTCALVWLVLHFAAFPRTAFNKWGIKKFGDADKFYGVIAFTCFLPFIVYSIYYLWAVL